nr:immunoglobulin heavy chain junction region [Mus musculus]
LLCKGGTGTKGLLVLRC